MKTKYYTIDRILKEEADYNIIFGERSNGKTFAVQNYGLKNYIETGRQMAIIRRYELDFKGANGRNTFEGIVKAGLVSEYSNGKWDRIVYSSSEFYLAKYDEELDKIVKDAKPFCKAFAITMAEHYKSTAYPDIDTILFDEFLTRTGYLPNEFIDFMNILSTIIRDRDNVKIFMLGNTVNKYSIYFTEMGLKQISKMKKGEIQCYYYGDNKLKVAVQYSDFPAKRKKSDKYFAFDNPKLNMITTGIWEMALYPHLPTKYLQSDVYFKYYILFDNNMLQCNIIRIGRDYFTYIHRKTTEIKDLDKAIIFTQSYSMKRNYFRRISSPVNELTRTIWWFYKNERVFYQDNEVGEIVRNYIQWSATDKGFV